MDVSKTSNHIQIKMSNPIQEPPGSPKAPSQDLKDKDVLFTFKIKTKSHNLESERSKDPNQDPDAKL